MLTAEPDGLLLHAMTSMAMLFRTLSARSQLPVVNALFSFVMVIGVPLVWRDWPYGPHRSRINQPDETQVYWRLEQAGQRSAETVKKAAAWSAEGNEIDHRVRQDE